MSSRSSSPANCSQEAVNLQVERGDSIESARLPASTASLQEVCADCEGGEGGGGALGGASGKLNPLGASSSTADLGMSHAFPRPALLLLRRAASGCDCRSDDHSYLKDPTVKCLKPGSSTAGGAVKLVPRRKVTMTGSLGRNTGEMTLARAGELRTIMLNHANTYQTYHDTWKHQHTQAKKTKTKKTVPSSGVVEDSGSHGWTSAPVMACRAKPDRTSE